jgi:hypothetical protein
MTVPLWLAIALAVGVGIPIGIFLLFCLVVGVLIVIDSMGFRL